jgi:phosphoribosylformylglycinamidine cyclo-ligase
MKKITYSQVGDNYETKDPIKKLAQTAAKKTAKNLKGLFKEESDSRGESAYVWRQNGIYMASVIEGLGTKNLVADATRKITGKTYYDILANDTVAYIINDLISVGAKPLSIHAYWAIEDNSWLDDKIRMKDLIKGWTKACDLAGVSWGGGETATDKGVIEKNTIDLAGSAVGFIGSKKRYITGNNLKSGDRIILIKSSGINASGISLARAIAKNLPKGYAELLSNGSLFGEAILAKCNIYAELVQELLDNHIDIHYISYISGHGLRKIMRARKEFVYILEKIFIPQEIFNFIQKNAHVDDYEMYQTYNMGQDYAIFIPPRDIQKALRIIKKNKFIGLNAGYVQSGSKKVIIKPKRITFEGKTLDLR